MVHNIAVQKHPVQNGAILVPKEFNLPKIMSYFALPKVLSCISLQIEETQYQFLIIEYPLVNHTRAKKALRKICKIKEIDYAAVINPALLEIIGRPQEVGLQNYIVDREDIDGIKYLSALLCMSVSEKKCLFKCSMGFISKNVDEEMLLLLTNDAGSIMVLEEDHMGDKKKNAIFDRLMADKGISVVFSRHISHIIKASDVLFVDEDIDLVPFQDELKNKKVIGRNNSLIHSNRVDTVLLWHQNLSALLDTDPIIIFNDEILMLMREYKKNEKVTDFLKRFPCICLIDEKGKKIFNDAFLKDAMSM